MERKPFLVRVLALRGILTLWCISLLLLSGCGTEEKVTAPTAGSVSNEDQNINPPGTLAAVVVTDATIEGTVEAIDFDAKTLTVGGETFWADDATLIDIADCYSGAPPFNALRLADQVKVDYVSADNYAGKIQVSRSASYLDAFGLVEAIDYGTGQLSVMGQTFWVDPCTGVIHEALGDVAFGDIALGHFVKIEFSSDDNYSRKVVVEDDILEIVGLVESIDYLNMTLLVLGQSYFVDENTLTDVQDCYLSNPGIGAIRAGEDVKIEFETPLGPGGYRITKIQVFRPFTFESVSGVIEAIDLVNMLLTVGGLTYSVDICSFIDADQGAGTLAELSVDDFVEMETQVDGNYARKVERKLLIEIDPDAPPGD